MKHRFIPLLSGMLLLALLASCTGGGQGAAAPPASPTGLESVSPSTPPASSPAETTPTGGGILNSFTAEDLEGNEVDQSIFADHDLTMVNIWATFCSPCLKEMPELGELNAEYADKGFQVVGIVIDVLNQDGSFNDEMVQTAKDAVELTGASYPHLLPSSDLIMYKLQFVSAVPETIFIDKDGNQVGESYLGARSKDQWAEIIDGLLEEVK